MPVPKKVDFTFTASTQENADKMYETIKTLFTTLSEDDIILLGKITKEKPKWVDKARKWINFL